MSEPTIKISELEFAENLETIKNPRAAIIIKSEDDAEYFNYSLNLDNRYYTKAEVEMLISGIDIPDYNEYDDSSLTNKIGYIYDFINKLYNGSLVNPSENSNSSDFISDIMTGKIDNILIKGIKPYNKILISDKNGKIAPSEFSISDLNILKDWNYKNDKGETLTIAEKIQDLENKIEDLRDYISNISPYHGSSYQTTEEITFDGAEYTAKSDGILVMIPYYSHHTGSFDIYINDTWVGHVYTCHGDGHSHDGCVYPIKMGNRIKIVKKTGKVGKQKAYFIS